MKYVSLVLAFVVTFLFASQVQAQPPSSYTVQVMNGAVAVGSPVTVPATSFACGVTPKAPVPTTPVTNPGHAVIDDPASPTLTDCVYTDPTVGGVFSGLPFATTGYTMTIVANYPAGPSAATLSLDSFSHPGVVGPASTGFRVIR